jgi:hypothetical protein
VLGFLRLAERAGWRTVFLGPAVAIDRVLAAAHQEKAELVAVSYRLTPENGIRLLGEFAEEADELRERGTRFAFGGTPPVCALARSLGFFEEVFDGRQPVEEILAYLKGEQCAEGVEAEYPATTIERIAWKAPYPLIRHHFGLPSLAETAEGIREIAEARVLDVISLGIDQDAQANFFHPERQDPRRRGAGGVPVRSKEDYKMLYAASRCGNMPLMRTYAGSDDLIPLAELYERTIRNAWGAIPLFWFNQMDGRGPWSLEESIVRHQEAMAWYGAQELPLEVNEPHHWGLRDAHDVIFVATAFLSAYNARAAGVRDYVAQMMLNSPLGTSDAMDLAKMLACLEICQPLISDRFRLWRQTRTGLLSYPLDPAAARAHLAASVYVQMALKPHIVHVVSFCEADHAAIPADVIEACQMARRSIDNALAGQPDLCADPAVLRRRDELVAEAQVLLQAVRALAPVQVADPWSDAAVLAAAVRKGLLDAPHLKNNRFACGSVHTRLDSRGACLAVHPDTGLPWTESARLASLGLGGQY